MVDVVFYTISKRENSTLVPTGGDTISVVLKDGCNSTNPVFLLKMDDYVNYTMFKWSTWYYFVTEIRCVRNNLFEIYGTVDVLATFKAQILASRLFVAYSSSHGTDTIFDARIAPRTDLQVNSTTVDFASYGRCYIAAIIGGGNTGFTQYYVIPKTELASLATQLTSDIDIITELREMFNNPLDAIVSVWESGIYPIGTHTTVVTIGSAHADGELLDVNSETTTQSLTIPWQYSDFRKNSPFTRMSLELPFIGVVEISPSDFLNVNTVYITYTIDYLTGDILYQLKNSSDGNAIATFSGNCYSQIPVASVQRNWQGVTTGVVDTVKNIVSAFTSKDGGGVGGVISAMAGTAGSYMTKTYSLTGGQGGGTKFKLNQIKLNVYTCSSASDPATLGPCIGKPLMTVTALTNLTGYLQTVGASVAIPAPDGLRVRLNALLDSGIYIE